MRINAQRYTDHTYRSKRTTTGVHRQVLHCNDQSGWLVVSARYRCVSLFPVSLYVGKVMLTRHRISVIPNQQCGAWIFLPTLYWICQFGIERNLMTKRSFDLDVLQHLRISSFMLSLATLWPSRREAVRAVGESLPTPEICQLPDCHGWQVRFFVRCLP